MGQSKTPITKGKTKKQNKNKTKQNFGVPSFALPMVVATSKIEC
jgi:hypothetical protein